MESSQTAEPDWNSIRQSYLQGRAQEEIAKGHKVSLYALQQQITRHGWAAMKSQALSIARQEVSDRIRNSLIASVMRDAIMFETFEMPPAASVEHEIASRNRARLIDSAARLIGWGDEDSGQRTKPAKQVIDV